MGTSVNMTAVKRKQHIFSNIVHKITQLPHRLFFRPVGNFNRWSGEFLFGRANAGRVARLMRGIRVLCALATITVAAVLFATGAISLTAGVVLPMWAAMVGGVAMVVNMIAIGFGMMANHMKIEEMYDREYELHNANNKLRDSEESNIAIPHGLMGYWKHDRRLFWMNLGRRMHDFNGVAGSLASFVGFGIALSAFIPGVSLPLMMTTTVAVILFLASRISSSLSATFANATYFHRLWAYKKVLDRNMHQYNTLSMNNNNAKATSAKNMVDALFNELGLDKDKSRYHRYIYFYCYKALFSFPGTSIDVTDKQKCTLKELINSICESKNGKLTVTRNKLRNIDVEHEFHVQRAKYKDKVSVLDALPILEKKIQTILLDDVADPLRDVYINHSYSDTNKCLSFTAKMAKKENPNADIPVMLKRFLTVDGRLNENMIATKDPLIGHPHRFAFFAGYHLPNLQETLAYSPDTNSDYKHISTNTRCS